MNQANQSVVSGVRTTIIRQALWVMMIGLIGGFGWAFALLGEVRLSPIPVTFFESFPGDQARWRGVHLGCLLNGILALVLAANLRWFELSASAAKAIQLGVIITLWGNTAFYIFAVFAQNRGLSLGGNVQGPGSVFGALSYLGGMIAAFALIYVIVRLLRTKIRSE